MEIRLAHMDDLDTILEIYAHARAFMRDEGNPQWGEDYPPRDLVVSDIEEGALHLLYSSADGKEEIQGVFAFFKNGDPIYDTIDGQWLNGMPHSAIHRVASAGKSRGVLRKCVEFCLLSSNNLKIDTSAQNKTMQSALISIGFKPCGRVFVPQVGELVAFQYFVG